LVFAVRTGAAVVNVFLDCTVQSGPIVTTAYPREGGLDATVARQGTIVVLSKDLLAKDIGNRKDSIIQALAEQYTLLEDVPFAQLDHTANRLESGY